MKNINFVSKLSSFFQYIYGPHVSNHSWDVKNLTTKEKRRILRKYFIILQEYNANKQWILTLKIILTLNIIGVLIGFISVGLFSPYIWIGLLFSIVCFFIIQPSLPLSDTEVDELIFQEVSRIEKFSIEDFLNIKPVSEPKFTYIPIDIGSVLRIEGIEFSEWRENLKIDSQDYFYERGLDGEYRASIYEMGVFVPSSNSLGFLKCYLHLIRGTFLNEESFELFYESIVSVNYTPQATTEGLPDDSEIEKIIEKESLTISGKDSKEITFASYIPIYVEEGEKPIDLFEKSSLIQTGYAIRKILRTYHPNEQSLSISGLPDMKSSVLNLDYIEQN